MQPDAIRRRGEQTAAAFTVPVPLAIGIHRAIRAVLPELPSQRLCRALRHWTGKGSYQKALAAPGAVRVDLEGRPVEPVTEEQRAGAHDHLKRLVKARQKAKAARKAAMAPEKSPVVATEPMDGGA